MIRDEIIALEKLVVDWREQGQQLRSEPEYDGGYADALLKCARELSSTLDFLRPRG